MSQTKDSPLRIRYATPADNILLAELGAATFTDSFAADNTPEDMARPVGSWVTRMPKG
jgi:hypothetical protein